MKVTELSRLCHISRPTIYKHIDEGLSNFEILKMYTTPVKQALKNVEDPAIKDLKEIKKIVAKMVIEYQNSLSKEIKFSDVNTIYEIVKKY